MTLISWRKCGRRLWLCALPILLLLTWSNAFGQSLTTGALRGSVNDQAGAPLGDVLVTLIQSGSGLGRIRTTDRDGEFVFGLLAPGDYELLIEREGFVPLRVTNVVVRPGRAATSNVSLRAAQGPVTSQDVVAFQGGGPSLSQPQFAQWFPRAQLTRSPFRTRELTEALHLSSTASRQLGNVEGLPISMLGYSIDGIVHRGVNTSAFDAFAITSLPLGGFDAAELVTNGVDVEQSGFAGPVLNGFSRRGAGKWTPSVFGRFTANASGEGLDDIERPSDFQAAGVVGGPLGSDSAGFLIGGEFRRYDAPFAAPFAYAADAGAALVAAAAGQQITLDALTVPGAARTEAISLFARAEWQLSERHRIETRVGFGTAPQVGAPVSLVETVGFGGQSEATTLTASTTMLSELSASTGNELRLGVTSDQQDYQPQSDDAFITDPVIPFTTVASDGFFFGGSQASLFEQSRRHITLSDAVSLHRGKHTFKLGAAFETSMIEQTQFFGALPTASFGSPAEVATSQGLLVQPIGTPATADFSLIQIGGFVQDTWRPGSGLELVLGLRYDNQAIPVDDLEIDNEWLRLTGLSNSATPTSLSKISPRFAVKWEPGSQGWMFGAGIGVYHSEADVSALAAAIGSNGRTRRVFGDISSWADGLPTDTVGSGRSLTLLSPGFTAPASVRASGGVTRSFGTMSVHVGASYRETNNLSRYIDLNRWSDGILEDQNGRPVFGQLVQSGELIVASPGSNRRFAGFDQVIGVNSDGHSSYKAATIAFERSSTQGIGVIASYTYSRTEDNGYGARTLTNEPQVAPSLLTAQGSEWEDGRSDFDIPHRFVVSADVPVISAVRIGAIYRYQSGAPFTPGFPVGVDVNGDGFAGNDPAFIGSDVANLLQNADCATSQAGDFAERNSCRMDAIQSLDMRLAAQVTRGTAGRLEIVVDAINVLQSDVGVIDRALYRVNASGALATNAGVVSVPLVPNSQFGQLQQRASMPRLLRVGLQYNW